MSPPIFFAHRSFPRFRGIALRGALAAAGAALVLAPAPVRADRTGRFTFDVHVVVHADISIGGGGLPSGYVDMGRMQSGPVCAWVRWWVEANSEAVRFYVAASDLWKAGDPYNVSVTPIPLHREGGVEFEVEHGGPIRGQTMVRPFRAQIQVDGFPAWQTDYLTIESSQAGHFSQYVTTSMCWNQNDPDKPQGEYGGVVALWGFVVPNL